LSEETRNLIKKNYSDCLCVNCLKELQNEPSMIVKIIPAILFILFSSSVFCQTVYPPPAGMPGTTAMYKDSSAFTAWATGCKVKRGYQDISNPGGGFASVGDSSMALGKALSNGVVSLGDGGIATCTFARPIRNGIGPDFAVFENSIDDTFLELAFVEVSSDGINFFRFPSHSLTDTTVQTGGFGSTDATKINNLAGKYRAGYGTPFDLSDLLELPDFDPNTITHVRVIDVVGSISNSIATRDSYNNKVNDPWPTAFPSGGFDLDAIGVINENLISSINEKTLTFFSIIPNPANSGSAITIITDSEIKEIRLMSISGQLLASAPNTKVIDPGTLTPGIYLLNVITGQSSGVKKIVIE
jgi:hypothetical protein